MPFLAHLLVAEVGDSIAAGQAGSVLGQLGAQVVRYEFDPDVRTSAGLAHVRQGKDIVRDIAAARALLDRADVVIDDLRTHSPLLPAYADVASYLRTVAAVNRTAWVTIAPFGLSGPHADYRGTDLVASATGGLLRLNSCPDDGELVGLPGNQAELSAGDFGVLAALQAHDAVLATGRPAHVEVSMQESVVLTGPFRECGDVLFRARNDPPGRPRNKQRPAPNGVFPCKDGYIALSVIEERQWARLVDLLGAPGWTSDIVTAADRRGKEDLITDKVSAWTSGFGKDECVELLQQKGIAAAPVNAPDEVLGSAQFRARGFDLAAAPGALPPLPAAISRGPEPARPGRAADRSTAAGTTSPDARPGPGHSPLRALRVTELSRVLAAPLSCSWLGALGCQVTRVEDPSSLDSFRLFGPYLDRIPGIERSSYFAHCNHSKRSRAIAFRTPEGRRDLDALVAESDVLLENLGGWRAAHERLTHDDLARLNGSVFTVSLSGYGHTGPMAQYRAYGRSLHAYSGLTYQTRDEAGHMVELDPPWADLATAIQVAAIVAASAFRCDENSWWADISMAEVVASRTSSVLGSMVQTPSPIHELADPSGIYPTRDGVPLAISVTGLDDAAILLELAGSASGDGLADALRTLVAASDVDDLFHWFQARGIACGPVWDPKAVVADEHLSARDFFTEVDHPVMGRVQLVGVPWRVAGGEPQPLCAPPVVGSAD